MEHILENNATENSFQKVKKMYFYNYEYIENSGLKARHLVFSFWDCQV